MEDTPLIYIGYMIRLKTKEFNVKNTVYVDKTLVFITVMKTFISKSLDVTRP